MSEADIIDLMRKALSEFKTSSLTERNRNERLADHALELFPRAIEEIQDLRFATDPLNETPEDL